MSTQVAEKFSDFFEKWLSQLQDLLQLVFKMKEKEMNSQEGAYTSMIDKMSSQEEVYTSMINKITSHHKEFYKFKWVLAHDDILSFFSAPIWLTPFENVNLWVTGWKPSAAFRLVETMKRGGSEARFNLVGLTDEQAKKIEGLRMKMRTEEGRVDSELERLQMAIADRKTVEMVRMEQWVKSGDDEAAVTKVGVMVEGVVKEWLEELEKVMKMADCARLKTLKGLLDIFNPIQGLNFLVFKAMIEIRIRELGKFERKMKLII